MSALKGGLAILVLLAFPAVAMAVDNNGPGSTDDLLSACAASRSACKAACKRPNTVSGQMQQGFCEDDCETAFQNCVNSIPVKGKSNKLDLGKYKPQQGFQATP